MVRLEMTSLRDQSMMLMEVRPMEPPASNGTRTISQSNADWMRCSIAEAHCVNVAQCGHHGFGKTCTWKRKCCPEVRVTALAKVSWAVVVVVADDARRNA